ncbi:MAG: hypothetical protein QOG49_776 [Frankiaceae bacterium]|nr:hypothetical protein [Frankiaceae bacterium]
MTQSRARSSRLAAEAVLAAVTVAIGVFDAASAVRYSGFTSGSLWLVAFAVAGLAGLWLVVTGLQRTVRARFVLGLLVAVLAPTVFGYPLNVLLLLAVGAETMTLVRIRAQARA